MNIITKREEYKIMLTMFKYYPVIGSLLMWLYVGYLSLGNNLELKEDTTSDSFVGMLLILFLMTTQLLTFISDILCFCSLHRGLLTYMGVVGGCISYEYFIGFGILLAPSRIIVLIVGAFQIINLIIHWNYFTKK